MENKNPAYQSAEQAQEATGSGSDSLRENYLKLKLSTLEKESDYEELKAGYPNTTRANCMRNDDGNHSDNGLNHESGGTCKPIAFIAILTVLLLLSLCVAALVISVINYQSLKSVHGQQSNFSTQFDVTRDTINETTNLLNGKIDNLSLIAHKNVDKIENIDKSKINNISMVLHENIDKIEELQHLQVQVELRLNGTKTTFEENFTTLESQLERRLQEVNLDLQNQINHNTLRISCGAGNWQRVAHLNMSDPSHQCPPAWSVYSANGVRACGRPRNGYSYSCSSVNYHTSSSLYSKVCGRVIGYQVGSTDVFGNQQNSINIGYVDGVSITYGLPRTHIWTYAAGLSSTFVPENERFSCPCLTTGSSFRSQAPPTFVGNNYYCESGNPHSTFRSNNILTYTDDPIWDGENCEGRCCSDGRTPPWFSVQLTNTTTSDIEVRICGTQRTSTENTPVTLLEIYTQ